MATWLNHPRYLPARDQLVRRLKSKEYRFRKLNPVLFLCGGFQSPRRDALRDFLQRQHPDLLLFYAEPVWDRISNIGITALAMEDLLAAMADMVIIVVESPGTFAELGAFSLATKLRQKLLPIVNEEFRGHSSFIATGPLKWVDADSRFAPTVYANFTRILLCSGDIESRLDLITPPQKTTISDLDDNPKLLLFYICDLVSVIAPASLDSVVYFMRALCGASEDRIHTLVGVALAMQLIKEVRAIDGTKYLARSDPSKQFHRAQFIDLPQERARHLSVLQTIPSARVALEAR